MQTAVPFYTDLVLVGGGHTHAIVLRKIGMAGLPPGVRVTLITNLVDTPYSGMLPCHISGLYDFDSSHIDLRPLTRFAGCRLWMDEMVGLDPEHQQIICKNRPPVHYDLLSIDIGSTPGTLKVPGASHYAVPAKPVPQLLQAWDTYLEELQTDLAANPQRPATIGIVGGGVGGVELALNMQIRLWQVMPNHQQVTIHLFHRGKQLATGRNPWTQNRLAKIFNQRNIQTHLQESVCAVLPAGDQVEVICESGLKVKCDRTFWVTNAAAPKWIRETGLATDDQGFIAVRDTLQATHHDNIFAAGDIATMTNHPRAKAGVFAVRQGPPLYENLKRALEGRTLKPFTPQKKFLNIIDLGDGSAIASRGRFAWQSRLFRRWKDWIDGNFMALFNDFPEMQAARRGPFPPAKRPVPEPIPHCAGCGSKVGTTVLTAALNRIQHELPDDDWPGRENIYAGLDAPDDAAIVRVPSGKLAVQTVDQFRALLDDPYILGQITVNHCLSDVFAMGGTAQTVMALVTLPYATDPLQTETLYQLLMGAQTALAESKTFLVGGHTTEGPGLSLGFACNGWIDPDRILRKSGLQPGQALILTKPIGTGTLFAADMQRAAKGRWVEAAVQQMTQSNQAASRCLQQHGVTACTDITGFGLAGHLAEMVQASKVAVSLDLTALPVLPGARATLAQGHLSSLHARNRQIETLIENRRSVNSPDYDLLFDPQTAGGLLAAVPADQVTNCLDALRQLGYEHSRCIGKIVAPQPDRAPLTIKKW
ncbi:MAG: selenide, water dikinase SelD [Cyanobacteria bacterium J06627_15]